MRHEVKTLSSKGLTTKWSALTDEYRLGFACRVDSGREAVKPLKQQAVMDKQFYRATKSELEGTTVTVSNIAELKAAVKAFTKASGRVPMMQFTYSYGDVYGVQQDGFCAPSKHKAYPYEMNNDLCDFSLGSKYLSRDDKCQNFEIINAIQVKFI